MTILPPANRERDTEPPERARESTAPPADLGPTGTVLRLLALEAKVDEIRAETFGMSKAMHDMNNHMAVMRECMERTAANVDILMKDARQQRVDRTRMREDLDELESRVSNVLEEDS